MDSIALVARDAGVGEKAITDSRSYQIEMLQESLRHNIIVAMDTGSGKTHIAALRIGAELERCGSDKLIWFLCPNVSLAEQQYRVLSNHFRSVQCRLLVGSDGVERWSEQQVWDAVLNGISVVVSTHQILLDALVHGFIRMARLALLVFDEAHHCKGNHSANRIMGEFYRRAHEVDGEVPHILGLTASPVTNQKAGRLQDIEQNLNAISKTPKIHRSELAKYVHQPQMDILTYPRMSTEMQYPPILRQLASLYAESDLQNDPYIIRLRASSCEGDSHKLLKALRTRKTYCQEHVKSLLSTAVGVQEELGDWACEYYISACLKQFRDRRLPGSFGFESLDEDERSYLLRTFDQLAEYIAEDLGVPHTSRLSLKVCRLIHCLQAESSTSFAGLVFVKTRASVKILSCLLSAHPDTQRKFSIGTFVGTSNFQKRKSNIGELHNLNDQKDTLDDLRYGRKNLIITTAVLEEGIDVSACNVVICFEKPPNLKAFIQRRGRARSSRSKYIIMFEEETEKNAVESWQQLEEDMRRMYMDDMRQLAELEEKEAGEEGYRSFSVSSTGATISLQDAVSHLYHWCSTLPKTQYSDLRPIFSIEVDETREMFRSNVILPKCVDKTVRETLGNTWWRSERLSKQDVAFEAYLALYKAGLVNEHLLPLLAYDEAMLNAYADIEKRPSLATVKEQFSPWFAVANAWRSESSCYGQTIRICANGSDLVTLNMISPFILPQMRKLSLFSDMATNVEIYFDKGEAVSHDRSMASDDITRLLLYAIYRSRMDNCRSGFPIQFQPLLSIKDQPSWVKSNSGFRSAVTLRADSPTGLQAGIIRDLLTGGTPYVFQGIEHRQIQETQVTSEGDLESETSLRVVKISKRADFPHAIPRDQESYVSKTKVISCLSPSTCTVDNLPFTYAHAAMYIPSIMHHIEVALITEHLCNSLLSPVQFLDKHLVTIAITAPVAREVDNYQSLEFLGDSCLKLYTSINIMAKHLNWHEGYLSHRKDHIVSNGRLALAAQQTGLDQYIITKSFTGHKWRPVYNDDLVESQPASTRELSTKTLADVVEALLGAAFLDGGYPKVLTCLAIFLPEVSWQSLEECRDILEKAANPGKNFYFPSHFTHLEVLIGYKFTNKSLLLEALTHASHFGSDAIPSYQRLEFIGDSILDIIVTTRVYHHTSTSNPSRMHLLRTALVNANFLAFACMKNTLVLPRSELLVQDHEAAKLPATRETTIHRSLWHFMRHSHDYELVAAQTRCQSRFDKLEPAISNVLANSSSYPWTLLVTLAADKFFSDLVESVIGAIYIDSGGSFPACEAFLTKFGILPYLDRALDEDLHVKHPKEELGIVAGNDKVRYEVENIIEDGEGVDKGYRCKVFIAEREISVVGGAASRIEAETKAAEQAIKLSRENVAIKDSVTVNKKRKISVTQDEDSVTEREDGFVEVTAGESDTKRVLGDEDVMMTDSTAKCTIG